MGKHLNPLEKEFLIRLYRGNPSIKLSEFCERNNISDGAFKKWLKQYEEGGLEGLARADKTFSDILPEGLDRTEESYKREIMKLRIEKEILSWRLAERRGSREQYIGGLADIVEMLKGHTEPTIIHTDQGSVYASIAYNELIKDTNIVRSMSRAGKPTDNPVNESLNGWIKEELFMDFHIDNCRKREDVRNTLENYVRFYNEKRPCYAIGYDTPVNYRKRFYKGELEQKKYLCRSCAVRGA